MIYVYETIPGNPGEKPKIYEIQQSMKDEALTTHPDTGEPIRRVVLGGFGILSSKVSRGNKSGGESGGCGPGCSCG
ncbi:MAG: zinc ribbon domain-containing protein [Thermodesulfobacteriota bacterium]|jgi:predicted nucleic acid-binding Zn ribbon protein|nr:MAG: zinc ribbon domain-containing protein [Thermodesulfobacteriota bacterium]